MIKPLTRQIVQWVTTGVVAKDKMIHVGIPQARTIVRDKAGKGETWRIAEFATTNCQLGFEGFR